MRTSTATDGEQTWRNCVWKTETESNYNIIGIYQYKV